MASVVVIFELASQKNCFLIRKGGSDSGKGESVQIQVFEASYAEGKKAYFTLFGGVLKSGDTVTINGLYAAKLGIKDLQQIILTPVSCSEMHCQKVQVEPLSVDDWEILERNASTLENCLLNQVRVVWPGQVLPVWVEKSMCLFITIGEIDPLGKFSLLGTNTTVEVTSKSRSLKRAGSQHQVLKMPYRQATQDQTDNSLLPDSPRKKEMHSPKKSQLLRQNTDKGRESIVRRQGLISMLSSLFQNEPQPSSEENDDHLNDMQTDSSQIHQFNLVYRIQSCNLVETLEEIKRNIKNRTFGDEVDYYQQPPVELLQPSTIYVSARDIEGRKSTQQNTSRNSKVFYAELKKLPSVQDKKKAELEKKNKGVKDNLDSQPARPDDGSLLRCIVRVVTVDRTTCITDPLWRQAALVVLKVQDLMAGHAFIPMLLRRQLKLDSTGCAWVKAGNISFTRSAAITIYPISIVPRQVNDFMLLSAFRQWVEGVADDNHPLVIFHGMLVKFNVSEIEYVEAQLLLSTGSEFTMLLSQSNVRLASITVQRGTKDAQLPDVLTPLLAYRKVKDFEPVVPSQTLDQLGGISGLTQGALRHLEVCLGSRPLPQKLFSDRPGLNHGLLLLTGPKGSGKTSLANALCRAMSQPPNLAAIFTMNCKPLRGKRVETIQSLFEAAFDEAAWRQPSILLLDDLDVIAPATNNPASEMSGEALYAAKVAQVLGGLVKFEMRNFTRMAVIVTSRSRSSLHHSIVASRGLHFVQEVTAITPPDKVGRRELLCSILEMHSTVAVKETLNNLNLDDLAERTEGFVARDLQVLVNRALHCRMADLPMTQQKDVVLELEDFTAALDGFKPLAIRNVQLHTAGDLGWFDVGGLEEVKAVLIETLQWPSKYPLLFANCPLRLRSGLLLYGPPGTGKTLLAGAVAKECGLNFISIKGPELLSKYIGASEQSVRDLFNRAQSARPCILFFDEFDSIAPRRGHDSTGVTDRVVNQLLTQLDGVEGLQGVYVLGATSRPDLIDPALLRPGRLDKCLYCGIPTQDERRSILRALTRKMCLADDVSLDDVADVCEDFTGADFKALLYNAQLQAINEHTEAEEQGLDDSIVRIQGSPGMCTRGWKPSIKFQPMRSPTAFTPTTRTARMGPCGDFGPGAQVEESKIKVIVACTDGTEIMVPGPGGDRSQVKGEDAAVCHKPKKPPSDLQLTKDGMSSLHKSKAVTFFPTISDGPTVLSPQDEARYLSMVEQIHRRAKLKEVRTNQDKRRASSVLAKPSMLIPVSQKHLLSAAENTRPSVSAAERQRYEAIYQNFVSGRHGDFNTGDLLSGLRATLA